jgi:hypothetical protein
MTQAYLGAKHIFWRAGQKASDVLDALTSAVPKGATFSRRGPRKSVETYDERAMSVTNGHIEATTGGFRAS